MFSLDSKNKRTDLAIHILLEDIVRKTQAFSYAISYDVLSDLGPPAGQDKVSVDILLSKLLGYVEP